MADTFIIPPALGISIPADSFNYHRLVITKSNLASLNLTQRCLFESPLLQLTCWKEAPYLGKVEECDIFTFLGLDKLLKLIYNFNRDHLSMDGITYGKSRL